MGSSPWTPPNRWWNPNQLPYLHWVITASHDAIWSIGSRLGSLTADRSLLNGASEYSRIATVGNKISDNNEARSVEGQDDETAVTRVKFPGTSRIVTSQNLHNLRIYTRPVTSCRYFESTTSCQTYHVDWRLGRPPLLSFAWTAFRSDFSSLPAWFVPVSWFWDLTWIITYLSSVKPRKFTQDK